MGRLVGMELKGVAINGCARLNATELIDIEYQNIRGLSMGVCYDFYISKMCIVSIEPLTHVDNDVKVIPMRMDHTE